MFHVKHSTLPPVNVSRETEAKLRDFAALVQKWNPTINLVSRSDLDQLWQRHILDSLQLAPLIPNTASHLTDIGSGGGFPAIVLAIATQRSFHLVESDARKCAFLREAARTLGLSATIHCARIEQIILPPAPVVTARALAPLSRLIPQAAHLLAPDGYFLFPKGRNAESELTEASREWQMKIERFASNTDQAATILKLSEVRPAGKGRDFQED